MANLIKEAYIDPIRSVIVVDDEYPTVLELLDGAEAKSEDDIKRLKEVISLCRNNANSWTLDIDNGQSNVLDNFSRISHSDLLILDYHLEKGNDDGKGEQALKVIDEIVENRHFNLVIVHTKGYRTGEQDVGDFGKVFRDILLRLFGQRKVNECDGYDHDLVSEAIDSWEEDRPGIIQLIKSSLSTLDFLRIVKNDNSEDEEKELAGLKTLYAGRPTDDEDVSNLNFSDLLCFVLLSIEKDLQQEFGQQKILGLNWCSKGLWIKTNNSFILVVGKDTPTAELPAKLVEALVSWNPHPHALLLSKFRHLVDEHGFSYVDELINKKYVQAGWLQELLKADNSNSKWVAQNTSERLLNSMSEHMIPEVGKFAHAIHGALLATGDAAEVVKHYHNLDVSDKTVRLEIARYINAYACSKPVVGNQISTGHIIDISGGKYICLTPACDLVPSQKSDWKNKLGDLMPFKLVKLWPGDIRFPPNKKESSDEKLLSRLNANEHIVFNEDNLIKCYSLLKTDGANPQWEQAFGHDNGRIVWDDSQRAMVHITQIVHDGNTPNDIGSKVVEGKVIAQLRYEYAINLLQKFGVAQSRVGLDFVAFR
ncbi:hypothetical protein FCV66_08135 [Enterovibrio norvegicus]|nr:hypothetical protein FCV66_08135 [Enterovibrio norvegicus]